MNALAASALPESTAGAETEPAEPEEGCAEDGQVGADYGTMGIFHSHSAFAQEDAEGQAPKQLRM